MSLKIVYWTAVAIFLGLFGSVAATSWNGSPRIFALCLLLVYAGLASVFFVDAASDLRRYVALTLVSLPSLLVFWGILNRR